MYGLPYIYRLLQYHIDSSNTRNAHLWVIGWRFNVNLRIRANPKSLQRQNGPMLIHMYVKIPQASYRASSIRTIHNSGVTYPKAYFITPFYQGCAIHQTVKYSSTHALKQLCDTLSWKIPSLIPYHKPGINLIIIYGLSRITLLHCFHKIANCSVNRTKTKYDINEIVARCYICI